jgi:CRISPR-associated protein Cmr4
MGYWGFQFITCLTPLHNGSGQGVGTIDRPIIREAATNLPFVQSSSLKGAYQDLPAFRADTPSKRESTPRFLFGAPGTDGQGGALSFTDARLLLFPVRSLAGTFALTTTPLILARLRDWLRLAETDSGPLEKLEETIGNVLKQTRNLSEGTAVGPGPWADGGQPAPGAEPLDRVLRAAGSTYVLEGLALDPSDDSTARGAVAEFSARVAKLLHPDDEDFWQPWVRSRVLVLHDRDFVHLTTHATQVEASIEIGEKGVTTEGSLRYTEYLPSETVLVSRVSLDDSRVGSTTRQASASAWRAFEAAAARPIQLGGDESKGKGVVADRWYPGEGPRGSEEEEPA